MLSKISKPTSKLAINQTAGLQQPLILVLFACAVIITGLSALAFGHKFGYKLGYQASQNTLNEKVENHEMTAQEFSALQSQVNSLTKQIESAKSERDISLKNLGQMRDKIESVEIKSLQLEQVNTVYSKALADKGGLPLQIVGAKIQPLPENAFEYRFDVAMLSKDNTEHRLRPKLTLLDEVSLVVVPLEPKFYDIKGVSRIRGRFIMPEGFTPKQAKLELSANGESLEQIYDWKLAKPIDQMPMSLSEVPETDQRPVTE